MILELNSLRKEVEDSISNVQSYLRLEWLGVSGSIRERYLIMNSTDEILQLLYSLLKLQQFRHKMEKTLAFCPIFCYYIVYFFLEVSDWLRLSFSPLSVYPNRLRPPCTTMPWSIWPALVVLWGVCWMFHEGFDPNWEVPAGLSDTKYSLLFSSGLALIFCQTLVSFSIALIAMRLTGLHLNLTSQFSNCNRSKLYLSPLQHFAHRQL